MSNWPDSEVGEKCKIGTVALFLMIHAQIQRFWTYIIHSCSKQAFKSSKNVFYECSKYFPESTHHKIDAHFLWPVWRKTTGNKLTDAYNMPTYPLKRLPKRVHEKTGHLRGKTWYFGDSGDILRKGTFTEVNTTSVKLIYFPIGFYI